MVIARPRLHARERCLLHGMYVAGFDQRPAIDIANVQTNPPCVPRRPQPFGRLTAMLLVAAVICLTCVPPSVPQQLSSPDALSFAASTGNSKLAIVTPDRAAELSRPALQWKDRLDWIPLTQLPRMPRRDVCVRASVAITRVEIPPRCASLVGTVELRI